MTMQKTYYSLDDGLFIVDGFESPQIAAERFRSAWLRSACPTISAPFRQSDITQAFAKANDDIDFEGTLSGSLSNLGCKNGLPAGIEVRIYAL